jgi:hypothetical protein
VTQASSKTHDLQQLDALTGGAFTAATSGDRAARIREWLASEPSQEQMQDVFRELSVKDKGAARPLREKLDEIKRAKGQEALAAEWAGRAQVLLDTVRLNIADAMAWQRDAAKAGAPLSREPLASLKTRLAERVRVVEDLQNQAMVQREASVLLAQRIELLSTKPLQDAQAAHDALRGDVAHWQSQMMVMVSSADWSCVDARFPLQMESARTQLQVVWDAFDAALAQAVAAAADPAAPLPPVPVWAEELRARREPAEPARPAKPRMDPAERAALQAKATQAVEEVLVRVEREVAEGHARASAGAATALRNALKAHGRHIEPALEARVHAALTTAGELEGWQRWRADQLREELVAKAEALVRRPKPRVVVKRRPAAPLVEAAGLEGQAATEAPGSVAAPAEADHGAPAAALPPAELPAADTAPVPAMGGRKMQETLRQLREQWKATDQGGTPNHALWKRFDDACNEAHKVVEAWLDKLKTESAEHRARRLELIAEVKAWTAANQSSTDWKAHGRAVHQFSERWREAGHLGEKAFAELQPLWKEAIHAAALPLETAQKDSVARRQALIAEATALGAAPVLRIDAVRALQQRWQAEAQSVPLERKHEQRLWDAFRKPLDDAFNRKSADREKAAAALSERDKVVLEAAKALEAANAGGDAQKIRAAMAALDAALRGQALAAAEVARTGGSTAKSEEKQAEPSAERSLSATEAGVSTSAEEASGDAPAAAPAPTAAPKRLIAMRGDDRPGMKKTEPAAAGRGGKFGDRKDAPRGAGRPGDNKFEPRRDDRGPGRFGDRPARDDGRFGDRAPREDRGPRLGDTAFRAQREALEHAEAALRKLAAQAHGEALTQLLDAWQARSAERLPSTQELGRAVTPAVRGAWSQALGSSPSGDAGEALLRLEMAAEVPTPADQIDARRALQLQLLTRRNDPSPAQTWGQDTARVLASAHDAGRARRLQNALKALLRR